MNVISIRFWKWCARGSLLAAALLTTQIAAADDFSIESAQGVVESPDFNANTIVVGGVRYDFAPDAGVEIGGSYGAFTMLTPGMKVKVLIRRYLDTGRVEIFDLKELPAGVEPKQY